MALKRNKIHSYLREGGGGSGKREKESDLHGRERMNRIWLLTTATF
jgi:hypothetical protein